MCALAVYLHQYQLVPLARTCSLQALEGMHDRWKSYDAYRCAHSICGAHLLRDCTSVWEQEHQLWAAEMHDLLVSMAVAADEWRQRGATAVPAEERHVWVAQYARAVGQRLCRSALARRLVTCRGTWYNACSRTIAGGWTCHSSGARNDAESR